MAPVPFGADIEFSYSGTRDLSAPSVDLRTLEPTTATLTDLSLETPIPEGARRVAGTSSTGGRTCGLIAMGVPPAGTRALHVSYSEEWGAGPTKTRLVRASGEVLVEGPRSRGGDALLSLPEEEGEPVFLLYVTGAVSQPWGASPFDIRSLEWR